MIQFTYSFCMAILHSFWQAAFLLLLYFTIDKAIFKNNAPLAKRNILYAGLATQFFLSALTFFIYFFNVAGAGTLTDFNQSISGYLGSNTLQSITPWIFGLYIFIIAYKLIKTIYSWYLFKQQYKTGLQKPTVDLKLFTELNAYQFGIKRKVTLWLSYSIQTPITFGFFKPLILLPVALLNNISTQQAETLVLHELTHIRTNDYLLNWFLLMAETIFFFNPFILSLCKKIRLEREKNCDINVLSFKYAPALYADTLLQAEKIKQLIPNFQLAAVSRKKYLLQRIQYFTDEKNMTRSHRLNIVAPLIGFILLLMLSVAVLMQAGKTDLSIQSATHINGLPFNNYLIRDAALGMHLIPEFNTNEPIHKKNESQQPIIVNKTFVNTDLVYSSETPKTEEIAKPVNPNMALPIAIRENDAARRIIVKEEGSGSASLQVYYLSYENGKWILQPEWVLTAKEIISDSLSLKIDSLKTRIIKLYPDQQ